MRIFCFLQFIIIRCGNKLEFKSFQNTESTFNTKFRDNAKLSVNKLYFVSVLSYVLIIPLVVFKFIAFFTSIDNDGDNNFDSLR